MDTNKYFERNKEIIRQEKKCNFFFFFLIQSLPIQTDKQRKGKQQSLQRKTTGAIQYNQLEQYPTLP